MSTVYTKLLGEGNAPPGTVATCGPVPVGFRWVATDITFVANVDRYQSFTGVRAEAQTFSGVRIFFLAGPAFPFYSRSAHWSGRQALDAGEYFGVQNMDPSNGVWWRITGFELKLP